MVDGKFIPYTDCGKSQLGKLAHYDALTGNRFWSRDVIIGTVADVAGDVNFLVFVRLTYDYVVERRQAKKQFAGKEFNNLVSCVTANNAHCFDLSGLISAADDLI